MTSPFKPVFNRLRKPAGYKEKTGPTRNTPAFLDFFGHVPLDDILGLVLMEYER